MAHAKHAPPVPVAAPAATGDADAAAARAAAADASAAWPVAPLAAPPDALVAPSRCERVHAYTWHARTHTSRHSKVGQHSTLLTGTPPMTFSTLPAPLIVNGGVDIGMLP